MTTFIRFAAAGIACLTMQAALAVTIPAGTTLVVRTLQGISSGDMTGTRVRTQLDNDISVKGTVALPAGTKISGRVESSKRGLTRDQKLTLNITDAQVHGRTITIKTTGAVELQNPYARTTQRGVQVSKYSYQVPAGTKVQFRLAQPLQI
jgi:hypothetical protein